jgi:UDP-N-acetylglucosamine 2-epimerase (non-hydrolysing)
VTGNPIKEVLDHYQPQVAESKILSQLELTAGGFFLVTLHRAENVDLPERLNGLLQALKDLWQEYALPIIISTHPRTRDRMQAAGLTTEGEGLRFLEPFGFFDFVALEKSARCVLSDSGTVQEECSIFRVPNVTLRDVTERPETVECGSNILAGADPEAIRRAVKLVMDNPPLWSPPREYMVDNVSETVVRLLMSYRLNG